MRTSFLLFLFFVSLCQAKEIPITILHTTDLHAHILPTTDYEGNPDLGGAARCATIIKKIRSEEKNVLLVDAGDLYQGTALGFLTGGSVMTRYVNMMNYTSWTLGNHEFDWGIDKVAARVNEAKIPVLGGNIHHSPTSDTPKDVTEAFKKIQPYVISEIEGLKIGIIGLTTPGIPNWSRPRLIPGLKFEKSVDTLKQIIPKLKEAKCDILILVTHQGLREFKDDHANQINEIAHDFPELDLIIGGHSHTLHKEDKVNGILYAQSAYWGKYLGRVDLKYDTKQKKIISKKSDPILMDSSIKPDPELLELLKPDLDRTEKYLNEKIGETTEILEGRNLKIETPVFNLLSASIAEAMEAQGRKVDVVIHSVLDEKAAIKAGPITNRDLFAIVPYENTIGVAKLTYDELREVLDEDISAYSKGRFRGIWGMTMKFKASAPEGERITFLGDKDGKPLDKDKTYLVAINSFDLASGGNRWWKLREIINRPTVQLKEYDFQTRDAVANYIRKHSPLKMETHNWWSLDLTRSKKGEE